MEGDPRASAVAISPDGKWVVGGTLGGEIHVWEARTGRPVKGPTGHTFVVTSLVFSEDSSHLLSGSRDGTATLWSVDSWKPARTFDHGGAVWATGLSRDGSRVLTAGQAGEGGVAKLWDAASGAELQRFPPTGEAIRAAALSPDGRLVAIGADDHVRIWDAATGTEKLALEGESQFYLTNAAFTHDGTRVCATGDLAKLTCWDVVSGAKKTLRPGHGLIEALALSPDGTAALTGSQKGTVILTDLSSGNELRRFVGHVAVVDGAAFTPGGQRVLTASWDGSIVLWDIATGNSLLVYGSDAYPKNSSKPSSGVAVPPGPKLHVQRGHSADVVAVSVSGDGRLGLTASEDGAAILWDLATGAELRRFAVPGGAVSVAFSPDASKIAVGAIDGPALLWSLSQEQPIALEGHDSPVLALAFSPDGRVLATGARDYYTNGKDHSIRLWDAATGTPGIKLAGHPDGTVALAFSSDGRHILSGGYKDKDVILWSTATGFAERRLSGHSDLGVKDVAFSPDGDLVTLDLQGVARRFGGTTGLLLSEVGGGQRFLMGGGLARDGSMALVSLGDGGNVEVLGLAPKARIAHFFDLDAFVSSAVFVPGGSAVLIGRKDGSAVLRETITGALIRELRGFTGEVTDVAWSTDGRSLLFGRTTQGAHWKRWVDLWSVEEGRAKKRLEVAGGDFFPLQVADVSQLTARFSPDGRSVLTSSLSTSVRLWDAGDGALRCTLADEPFPSTAVGFASDGRTVAFALAGEVVLTDVDCKVKKKLPAPGVTALAFAPGGNELATADLEKRVVFWDVATGEAVKGFSGLGDTAASLAFSPDGQRLAAGLRSHDPSVLILDPRTAEVVVILRGHTSTIYALAWTPTGSALAALATASFDGSVCLWNAESGDSRWCDRGHEREVTGVAFSPDGEFLLTGSRDQAARLLHTDTGGEALRLVSFLDGSWVVTDPAGRFDTSDLESLRGVSWTLPDRPLESIPLEAFLRDYYEPRLLPRVLGGEVFPAVKALLDLDRAQPDVRVISVEQSGPAEAVVTVELQSRKAYQLRDGQEVEVESGVHDLRLFRDGQLVAWCPPEHGAVPLEASGRARLSFKVKLPGDRLDGTPFVFSAYAFNGAGVKGPTHRLSWAGAKVPKRKGTAYVISMGISASDSAVWKLQYAARDAERVQKEVPPRLTKSGRFAKVIAIALSADGTTRHGTKATLEAVLDRLAGRDADAAALAGVPNAEVLRRAEPEDLILLTFSGHGCAEGATFHLFPTDIGADAGSELTPALLARTISSDDLSRWLRDVDAGELALVIDACHSAPSLEAGGFRPGPMGSRGLGQLAFDKGMRVLAASQADDVAYESIDLEGGLLTYALVEDGLVRGYAFGNARNVTLRGWLAYAMERTPELRQDLLKGRIKGVIVPSDTPASASRRHPALFDFSKGRPDVLLSR